MINAVRILSIDQVQAANSGHPGAPLGAAPMVTELFANHMRFNPKDPEFIGRDRFVLSAGHASAMQYSLLHLLGYDIKLDDLKNFRQYGSITPGHPEYRQTPGIECSTGPLGAGVSMAVGMAIAQEHLAAEFNKGDDRLFDNYTYVYAGDGCMMEGISYEAGSLAGTLKLGRLIVLYDSNDITIEGNTDIAFTEDVAKRYEAFNWQVLRVEDGNDTEAVGRAIQEAKAEKTRPSLIIVKSVIGYGSPERQGTPKAHGEPLGEENCKELRKTLGWNEDAPFVVPDSVYDGYKKIIDEKIKDCENRQKQIDEYFAKYPEMKVKYNSYFTDNSAKIKSEFEKLYSDIPDRPVATRSVSGDILQRVKDFVPNLIGGSADLSPSNKSDMKGIEYFSHDTPEGRNMHFGVRELAMTGIANGIMCYGGLKAYIATFFVFSDYTKPMLRLSSLMGVPLTMIFTHDSIGVGEDGPTHQPIEQFTSLRGVPDFNLIRPADYVETVCAWQEAMLSKNTPTALVLSRQNLPQLKGSSKDALNGGYVISDSQKSTPDGIIIATGSEVQLALDAQELLKKDDIDVRVVSMPCTQIFDRQPDEYKQRVLPKSVKKRVAVEAAATLPWYKYVGLDGAVVGIDSFGISAPAKKVFEHFGIDAQNIAKTFKKLK